MKHKVIYYLNAFRRMKFIQKAAIIVVVLFVFTGLFSTLLSDNKPLICSYRNEIYITAFRAGHLRKKLIEEGKLLDFSALRYDWAIWPLIRYIPSDIDEFNTGCVSPFGPQNTSNGQWHYMGTDELGRDVASGLIHGARISLVVGLGAMAISLILGLIVGLIAGYLGDDTLKYPMIPFAIIIAAGCLLGFWIFVSMQGFIPSLIIRGILWIISLWILIKIVSFLNITGKNSKTVKIPVDFIIQRSIELFKSIPGFFLLLVALLIVSGSSLFHITVIIGVLSWPRIAQYVRAECLRIKQMPYVRSAQYSGFSSRHIIRHHILPGVLTSVVIYVAFGIGSAILLESTLSFLGLGLGTEHLTWGALLSESRKYFYAWWLAIFPGFAIFIIVYSFNILGELLLDISNPMRRIS